MPALTEVAIDGPALGPNPELASRFMRFCHSSSQRSSVARWVSIMDKTHPELAAPPDLTLDEVRKWAERAITETEQAKARAYAVLAHSQRLLEMADELLAKR